ncbi:uncharacterized protein METZ01_LOCUS481268, partial [marine metagenome]
INGGRIDSPPSPPDKTPYFGYL